MVVHCIINYWYQNFMHYICVQVCACVWGRVKGLLKVPNQGALPQRLRKGLGRICGLCLYSCIYIIVSVDTREVYGRSKYKVMELRKHTPKYIVLAPFPGQLTLRKHMHFMGACVIFSPFGKPRKPEAGKDWVSCACFGLTSNWLCSE